MMLQKIYISSKCSILKNMISMKILNSSSVFSIDNNKKSAYQNVYVCMLLDKCSVSQCDTEKTLSVHAFGSTEHCQKTFIYGYCSSIFSKGNDAFDSSKLFIIRSDCCMLGRQLQQDVTRVHVYSSQSRAERSSNESKQSSPVTSA